MQLECPPLTAAAPMRLRVVRRVVPDLPLVDVPACALHGERFAELRHDATGTPLPPPAGAHLALALSNGNNVLRYFVL